MEPMVIFGAGVVIYCGCLSLFDAVKDLKRIRVKKALTAKAKHAGMPKTGLLLQLPVKKMTRLDVSQSF